MCIITSFNVHNHHIIFPIARSRNLSKVLEPTLPERVITHPAEGSCIKQKKKKDQKTQQSKTKQNKKSTPIPKKCHKRKSRNTKTLWEHVFISRSIKAFNVNLYDVIYISIINPRRYTFYKTASIHVGKCSLSEMSIIPL